MTYQFLYNQISEGQAGCYIFTVVLGEQGIDWTPLYLDWSEHRN